MRKGVFVVPHKRGPWTRTLRETDPLFVEFAARAKRAGYHAFLCRPPRHASECWLELVPRPRAPVDAGVASFALLGLASDWLDAVEREIAKLDPPRFGVLASPETFDRSQR